MYAATTTLTAAPNLSFLKLLLVFTAGGLFFSTVIAAVTACYAMGMDNVKRLLEIFSVVVQRVWTTFTLGLGATKRALIGGEEEAPSSPDDENTKRSSWKWKSGWTTFKEQLGETRRKAAEGVQALRQEAKLYAAAVGPPGLIPLQYMLDRLMPLSLSTILEDSIKESLSSIPRQKTIKKMTLSSFTAGGQPPILQAARVYDVENAIAFDYDVKWDSQLEATVQIYTAGGLARVPVQLKQLQFEGVVRILLTPLVKTPPGYGAMLVSLPTPPKINLDVRVLGGQITRLPFLRTEITAAIQKAIADQLLWPRRVVIPTLADGKKPILTQKQLTALETSDPLLLAEEALASTQPILRKVHEKHTDPNERKHMFQIFLNDNTSGKTDGTAAVVVVPKEDEAIVLTVRTTTNASTTSATTTPHHDIDASSAPILHHADNYHDYASKIEKGVLWERLQQRFVR
jgi:hypothetical protein